MRLFLAIFAFVVVATVSIAGFRGSLSKNPPLEVFPDMDRQAKFKPQVRNPFFADGLADRPTVPGSVPYITPYQEHFAFLQPKDRYFENEYLQTGRQGTEFGRGIPVPVDLAFLERGQDRYRIFCQVCHGETGDGNGVTKPLGMSATPTYHDDRLRFMPDGEIYNTIVHGKNLMGAYGAKLSVEDRWAVVAYVRVLQRARTATVGDVPAENRSQLGL